jgi:peptidoglycan/LPS O-acetylase OafA/YrhL
MEKINYLKTITSLRGLSVLGVLLYHSKYPYFQNGYLGVDVFFVISGFLIGNILISEIKKDQFLFSKFYIRRLRRLLPSLIFTTVLTYIISYIFLLPEDFHIFKNSVPYVLLFTGNLFFWKTNDYFSPSTDIMPLSHLWSLGVEEQFYLIFPLIIFIIFKFKFLYKNIIWVLIVGAFLSFSYTIFGFYNLPFDCPTTNCIEVTNFYWLHTRAWEILIGVLLNFINVKKLVFRNLYIYLGLTTVLFSFIYNPINLSHPGLATLPAILGTVLIILSSLNNDINFLSRFSFIYFLGKISYSLYLIHFPIFVIRNYFEFKISIFKNFDILPIILISLSILVANLMWKFVEEPFRNFELITNKRFLISLIIIISAIIAISISSILPDKTLNSEYENFNFATNFDIKRECFFEDIPSDLLKIDSCLNPIKDMQNVLVIGSSIAKNIYNGLSNTESDSINFDLIVVTGCPPFVEKYDVDIPNFSENKCEVLYKKINQNLKDKNYSRIVISYQWGELIDNNKFKDVDMFDYTFENILIKIPKDKILVIGQPVRWNVRLNVYAIRELNLKNSIGDFSSSNFDKSLFSTEDIFKMKIRDLQIDSYSLVDFFCNENKCLIYKKVDDTYYFVSNDFIHISDYFSYKIGNELSIKLKN